MFRLLLMIPAFMGLAAAEPFPVLSGPFPARLEDHPTTTILTHAPAGAGLPPFSVRIDWLGQEPPPTAFTRSWDPARKTATSTHQLGRTHVTRTVLATQDAIFLHFLADSPGALSFRTTLQPPAGKGAPQVENRREISWSTPGPDGSAIRVWVIPFESDVETQGGSILLRGEGECLVVITAASPEDPRNPVAACWNRLATRHDPGVEHPDPTKIWQAISARAGAP